MTEPINLSDSQLPVKEQSSLLLEKNSLFKNISKHITDLVSGHKVYLTLVVIGIVGVAYIIYNNFFKKSASTSDADKLAQEIMDAETDNMLQDLDVSLSKKINSEDNDDDDDEKISETDEGQNDIEQLDLDLQNLREYNSDSNSDNET